MLHLPGSAMFAHNELFSVCLPLLIAKRASPSCPFRIEAYETFFLREDFSIAENYMLEAEENFQPLQQFHLPDHLVRDSEYNIFQTFLFLVQQFPVKQEKDHANFFRHLHILRCHFYMDKAFLYRSTLR